MAGPGHGSKKVIVRNIKRAARNLSFEVNELIFMRIDEEIEPSASEVRELRQAIKVAGHALDELETELE